MKVSTLSVTVILNLAPVKVSQFPMNLFPTTTVSPVTKVLPPSNASAISPASYNS